MRNKRETDISQYKDLQQNELSKKADGGIKRFFRGFGKFLITVCSVCLVALLITGISLAVYIFTIASEPTGIDLKAKSMNQTSRIYIQNEDTKEFKEYQKLYDTENRIWVDNQDIPQAMKDAGVSANVRRVADSAFLLEAQEVELPKGFVRGNTIGINISPLIFEYTKYKEEALAGIFDLVQEILDTTDSAIALIPHVVKPGNDDLEVLKLIYERYSQSGRIILITDKNCMQLKYIISQCRLFIGARTHATIAAYSTCVPTLVIGYSVKSRGIAIDLFGTEEHYVLPIQKIRSSEDLIKEYRWLMLHEKDIKLQLQKIMPEYREKAKLGMKYIEEILEN